MRKAALTAAVVVLSLLFKSAMSGAQVTIRFMHYRNDWGLIYNGRKCDPLSFWGRSSACDPYFTISVHLNGRPIGRVTTNVAKNSNTVQFGAQIVNVPNPLVYNVNSYGGPLGIQVSVDDFDRASRNDHMGSFAIHYGGTPIPFYSIAVPQEIHQIDNGMARAVLVLQISVQCHLGYYGPDCGKSCQKERDPSNGYYDCDASGNKVCLPTYDPRTDCKRTFCQQLPCQNGGNCSDLADNFACTCGLLFGGRTCTGRLSACESGSTCRNGGTCLSGTGHSGCACPPGFAGHFCEHDVDECAEVKPCRGVGSDCHNWFGTYSCNCGPGWRGRNCTEDVDECAVAHDTVPESRDGAGNSSERDNDTLTSGMACYNGGRCENLIGDYACRCIEGFKGKQCEDDIDECQVGQPCTNVSQLCQNLEGGFACLCRPGYSGPNCTETPGGGPAAAQLGRGLVVQLVLVPLLLLVLLALAAVTLAYFWRRRRRQQQGGGRGHERFRAFTNKDSTPLPSSGADNPVYDPYEEPGPAGAELQEDGGSPVPPLPPLRPNQEGRRAAPAGRDAGSYMMPG